MKVHVAALLLAAGCATSPDAPDSTGTFSADPTLIHARAQQGNVFHGAPYHKWTVTLSTMEGCAGDSPVAIEIDTLASVTAMPTGPIMMRATLDDVGTPPSAYLTYAAATPTSGTMQVDTVTATFVTGSFTAQVTIAGAPTTLTGTFSGPICP